MDIGTQLRNAREARGLTLDALSRSTRVQPRILSAIEQNDSMRLPPRPYGRGFVRAYASEVGLDPEGTVRDFFSQFVLVGDAPAASRNSIAAAPRPAATAQRWRFPVTAVLTYAVVGGLVILVGRWAIQDRGEAGAVGTAGTVVPVSAPAVERPAPPPAPPQAPAAAPVSIGLEAQQAAWVTATVDGERAVYRILQPGERVRLDGAREVTIRVGDAGAVTWQVNGRVATTMGQPGEVRTARVTPENAGGMK
jgi:cytoskeleton protein RodZ